MKKGLSWYNLLFKILLYIVNFFILIGEITEKTFLFILRTIGSFFKIIFQSIINVAKFVAGLFSSVGKNFTRRWKMITNGLKKLFTFKPVKLSFPPFSKLHIKKNYFRNKFVTQDFFIKFRYFVLGCLVTLLVFFLFQSYTFVANLPSPNNIGKTNYPLTTHIYDRNGKLLYEIYHDQNRTPIKIDQLPTYVAQATIAMEDKDFYRHAGVSLFSGILRAVKENLFSGNLQGGSTITQQLVKSSLLTPEKTIVRKVKEIILAIWTEKIYTKKQILEMYLNQVPYGGSSYGIEEASRTFFGKHAQELTLAEAAFLAALPQAPSMYSPYINPQLALKRRNEILEKMYQQKYITLNEKVKSQKSKLDFLPPNTNIKAPHFVFYVKSQLENMYGIREVEEGGLRVVTTLDLDIQEQAEKILKEELEKVKNLNVTNGAILVTRPETGEILAMVGSADYFSQSSGAFNVTTALRQPGSSIKPLMYSLALEKNYTAASIVDDSPVIFNIPGSSSYKPENYDGKFHGKIPLRLALANSFNIPAVRVLSTLGVEEFVNQAKKMGISTWTDSSRFGLSLTLGGGEVKMTDMATAFGVFANGGYRTDVQSILEIKNANDQKIWSNRPTIKKVLNEGISYIISDILSDNFARQWAFGTRSTLEIPGYKVAVKTGTTDQKKDNWTIGYTPEFLTAVWVGNNDNQPMNQYLSSGITGAAPIWNRVMTLVLNKYSDGKWFTKPDNIVEKTCFFGRKEYFLKGSESKASCQDSLFGGTPTPTP